METAIEFLLDSMKDFMVLSFEKFLGVSLSECLTESKNFFLDQSPKNFSRGIPGALSKRIGW